MKKKLLSLLLISCGAFSLSATSCAESKGPYKVTFDYDNYEEVTLNKGEKIERPSGIAATDTYISGWYTDKELKNEWDFENDIVNQNLTLYPKTETLYTITELAEEAKKVGEEESTERFYVRGIIDAVTHPVGGGLDLTDNTTKMHVYNTYDRTGEIEYQDLENKPDIYDDVVLAATIHTFNGTPEIKRGYLQEFESKDADVNFDDYKQKTITEARDAEKDTLVKVTGVVSGFTKNIQGNVNGYFITDDQNSIYVYDSQFGEKFRLNDKVEIYGAKDYYINADEAYSAEKLNYKGALQISNVVKGEVISSNATLNLDWVKETSIKEILDTPNAEVVTSSVHKVNALVKKEENPGFVNYYLYDIDGKTGSYVYTQQNGKDFSWLDEFDGKICTVYVSVINCKASGTNLIRRFYPISVKNENYKFDLKQASKYVVEYEAVNQFESKYYVDRSLRLQKTFSNPLIGLTDIPVSYTSLDDALTFEDKGSYIEMHTIHDVAKTVSVEVSSTFNDVTYKKTIEIVLDKKPDVETISVADAISSEHNAEVIVEGVVGPSLVNKDGFYIVDNTGNISVFASKEELGKVNLGDQVILKGTKQNWTNKDMDTREENRKHILINNAEILWVGLPNQELNYPISDEINSAAEFVNMPVDTKNTAKVFRFKAYVYKKETAFSSNYLITNEFVQEGTIDESDVENFMLYSSNGSQYAWLSKYVGKEVTIDVAASNFNYKDYNVGTVLAVTYNGETEYNILNFSY